MKLGIIFEVKSRIVRIISPDHIIGGSIEYFPRILLHYINALNNFEL